jgi:predicted RNase H-like nuclease (RuvC/YqgF family)
MRVYAGIDTYPSHAHTRSATFAVTLLYEDGTKRLVSNVKMEELNALIRRYGVDVLAFDNLAELAPNLNRLIFELSKLERTVEFMEVTREEPLEVKASKLGLSVAGRLSPERSSELIAELAKAGLGKKLDFFSPKTVVKVVRRRVPGSGGSSTLRFKRGVEGQIKYIAQRIREKLVRASLDFDSYIRESTGGYSSAVFVVYAQPEALRGMVYSSVTRNYAVRVERLHSRFKYRQPANPRRPVIVGYDPGISSAVAVLSVEGALLRVLSAKNLDRTEVISACLEVGKPVIVSTDVNIPPDSVRKLSAAFGAKLYFPQSDLTIDEKRELARKFDQESRVKNSHERDAIAAAAKAYLHYSQLLDTVRKKASTEGFGEHLLYIVEEALKGKGVARVIDELRMSYATRIEPEKVQARSPQGYDEQKVEALKTEIALLNARIGEYERKLLETEQDRRLLEHKLRMATDSADTALRRDREIALYEQRLSHTTALLTEFRDKLQSVSAEVERLNKVILGLAEGRLSALRVLDDLSYSSLQKEVPCQRNEVLYVRNPSLFDRETLNTLAEAGILGFVVPNSNVALPQAFEDASLPAVSAGEAHAELVAGGRAVVVDSFALREVAERKKILEIRAKERKLEEIRRLFLEQGV